MTERDAIQAEVDRNYAAFKAELATLKGREGKFALMRDQKIITFYDTFADAYATGQSVFQDHRFSIQKVTNQPVDLGFLSHALRVG